MIKYFLEPAALSSIDLRFERKTPGASGFDLMANVGMPRVIMPVRLDVTDEGKFVRGPGRWVCNTGLRLSMPIGVEAQVRTRSGICRDHGIVVANAPGTVDSDYRGEIQVTLMNLGDKPYEVLPGDRVAQLVFTHVLPHCVDLSNRFDYDSGLWEPRRVETLDELGWTDRMDGGHGSTGR